MGSTASTGGVIWEWEDDGGWRPYSPAVAKSIEDAFIAQRTTVTVSSGPGTYDINLEYGIQENTSTHFCRTVRRLGTTLPATHTAFSEGHFEWDDTVMWRPFDATNCATLLTAHKASNPTTDISIAGRPYKVDLVGMTQTNPATGFARRIRFVPRTAVPATAGTAAAGAGHHVGAGAGTARATSNTYTMDPAVDVDKLDRTGVEKATAWVHPVDHDELASQSCSVCMMEYEADEDLNEVVRLGKCHGHYFHIECIVQAFGYKPSCPNCAHVYLPLTGTMPKGTMRVDYKPRGSCPLGGYEKEGTIVLHYHFPNGTQGPEHPSPGEPYSGTSRTAFVPDTEEGREVVDLLVKAFKRRVSFTVGTSLTTGQSNCVIWNGVHHKTSQRGGTFGWPDETYFARVKDELKQFGIEPEGCESDDDMSVDSDDSDGAAGAR